MQLCATSRRSRAGFTLTELLVVIATLAVLATLLLPALAGTSSDMRGFQCLNNQRRVLLAWRMYADDYADNLPRNTYTSGGNYQPGEICWVVGNMAGTIDKTNWSIMIDSRASQLAPYNQDYRTYKCPADPSTYLGTPRVRSISMNTAIGYGNGVGAWLTGSYNADQTEWLTYPKLSSITRPSPENLWVLIDENNKSINDPCHANQCGNPSGQWIDIPASYHNGAAGLTFADGHTEIRKWSDPAIMNATGPGYQATAPYTDLRWLQARTSARR